MTDENFDIIDMRKDPFEVQLQRYGDLLARHIVVLFRRDSQRNLQSCGTGLLVSAPPATFLISAAHVFDDITEEDICFYAGGRTLRNVTGEILVTSIPPGRTRDDDRIDVGVCKLEGEGLPPYPDINKVALPITALRPFAYPREHKRYLFTGFPASKSKLNPHYGHMGTKPYAKLCRSASRDGYTKLDFDPNTHIVVPFNHRKVRGRNGRSQTFPEPVGISGSPLWLLFDEVNENDPNHNFVVGIVTEYHEDKCLLVATDIAVATWLINKFD